MTNEEVGALPRWLFVPQTIQLIRERYGVHVTRGMVYRRGWQRHFNIVEDKVANARPLIEKQSVIDYYEKVVGITPIEEAWEATGKYLPVGSETTAAE